MPGASLTSGPVRRRPFHAQLRQIHFWVSVFTAVPILLIVATGLLLQFKKDLPWIQPPTQIGSAPGAAPAIPISLMLEAAAREPRLAVAEPADVQRIQIEPAKGIAKLVSRNGWEMQIDTANGRVIQVARRRSDLIEALHDGSFFGPTAKVGLFAGSGVALFVLAVSGTWLFVRTLGLRSKRKTLPH